MRPTKRASSTRRRATSPVTWPVRNRLRVADQLAASEVDRRQRVDAELVESRAREARALEAQQNAAAAAAVAEGRAAAGAEERDMLRGELAEVRAAAERDRREARERLEALVGGVA
jgi:hypothetical protein